MKDYHPQYTNDDLLALYSFSGGVPKYVELFCDNRVLTVDEMIDFMVRDNSPLQMKEKFINRGIRQELRYLLLNPERHLWWV